jgi:hypothetical protein
MGRLDNLPRRLRWLIIGSGVFACLAGGQHAPVVQSAGPPDRARARRIAENRMAVNFSPSLQVKEATDFLLTQALLMQQAVSEGVIITYPSE